MARKKRRAADEAGGEHRSADAARGGSAGEARPRKLYSPGEVVRASGISRQVLHNYTVLGLVQPAEITRTNRRYYDERVFGRIDLVRRMLASGYRLTDLRETFKWED